MKKSKRVVLNGVMSVSNPGRNLNTGRNKRFDWFLPVILLLLFLQFNSYGITYYSRTSGGNWTTNSTWSTVAYGNATNTGTYPQAGDIANIGNTYTVNINSSVNCATLMIGQGTSGALEFLSAANYTLTVTGNITVNTGAMFRYNIGTTRTHSVIVGGNFLNFGTVDFYFGASQIVNLTFNGVGNSTISGNGSWDLNTVTLNKSGATTAMMNVLTNNFENGIRNFIGTYGTYTHNNAGTYNINPTPATFTIGPNVRFNIPQGTMWFAKNADNVYLQGSLYVSGGNVLIGSTAGLQGLRSDQNGAFVPYLEVTSGTLTVHGGITHGTASGVEPFSFRMTGGNILTNIGTTGSNRQIFYITDVAASIFNMTGGTITLQRPNIAGTTTIDFSVCGNNGTVTSSGGTIQFGNNSSPSPSTFSFRPYAGVVQPNFKITGLAATAITLGASNNSTSSFRLLSLYIDIGKTFDIRSISGVTGDSKTMTLSATANGVDALYNNGTFTQRLSTVTLAGTAAQAIGGTTVTTFNNLSINNAANVTLNRAANVNSFLSMVSGNLITTNTNILTCNANANASLGTASSYVDGPMVHTIATAVSVTKTYPIGKSTSYRPVVLTIKHSSAASVTYRSEIFNIPAVTLPYTLPPTITNVSNVRYVKFTRQPVANFTSGRIQMYYATDDGVADKNTLLVAHDDGASTWQNFGGVATANWNGNILSNTFFNFNSYFALGNPPGGGNPLPIELSSFNAKLVSQKVYLDWTTQTEINNEFFTIERSTDDVHYTSIGMVEGHGTSSMPNSYSLIDPAPLKGISYYRLRQTDFDGHYTTFIPRVINNTSKSTFTAFPNPASSPIVHLSYGESSLSYYSISVQDLTGRSVPVDIIQEENGGATLHFDEATLSKGIYIIKATDGQEILVHKLLVE